MTFDLYFIDVCTEGSNEQYSSIDSDNEFALTRPYAIIWSNDDKFTDPSMRCTASMSQWWYAYINIVVVGNAEHTRTR